jgi:hypothetical protein
MSIIFDSSVHYYVNPEFGRGVLRSLPVVRLDCSLQDLLDAAQLYGELEDAGRPCGRVPEGVCENYGFELERVAALELSEMGVRRYESHINGSGSLCQCGEIGRTCDACLDEAYESYRLERRAEFLPTWDEAADDDDRTEQVARKLLEEERYDPSEEDLDGWDADPDASALDNRGSEQELAEMGVAPTNRGYNLSAFGHDCTADRPSAGTVTFEKLVAAYQDERRGPKGRKVSLKAARQGVRNLQAMGMLPWVLPAPKKAAR